MDGYRVTVAPSHQADTEFDHAAAVADIFAQLFGCKVDIAVLLTGKGKNIAKHCLKSAYGHTVPFQQEGDREGDGTPLTVLYGFGTVECVEQAVEGFPVAGRRRCQDQRGIYTVAYADKFVVRKVHVFFSAQSGRFG